MNSQTLTYAGISEHFCSKRRPHARVCPPHVRRVCSHVTQIKFNRRDVALRDLDGRMTRWELKNGVSYIQRDVLWDNASRVTNLKDLLTPAQANNQGFGYDALDRLTTTNLGTATTPSQTLAYDAIGNRTSATINGIISTYNLPTNSHKLTSTVGGTNPRAFTYDAMGNLTFDGKYVSMVVCTATSQGLGIGMPWSIGFGQVCQVALVRQCKKEALCEWPETSNSPFSFGP
jgi:YD repeat-containing protein